MSWNFIKVLGLFVALVFGMAGCGGGGGGSGTPAPIITGNVSTLTVSGTASEGALITGKTVNLKDANGKSAVDGTTDATTGIYSIDVTGLAAPFLVTVTGTNGTYVSLAQSAGTANINPITTTVVALAAGTSDMPALFTSLTPAQLSTINTNYTAKSALVSTSLQAALPAGVKAEDYFTGTITASKGMDAVFDTYQIAVHPTTGITVKTKDASTTTVLTIPVSTVTANTTQSLPTIIIPPTPTPTPTTQLPYSPPINWINSANGVFVNDATNDRVTFRTDYGYMTFGNTYYVNMRVIPNGNGDLYFNGVKVGAVTTIRSVSGSNIAGLVCNNGYMADIIGFESTLAIQCSTILPVEQNTSTSIITSYMSNKHQVESTSFATDLTALKLQLAMEGRPGGSAELNATLALKLSHIQNFINVSLQYAINTKSTYILDRPAIKSLFMSYQTTDKADLTSTLSSVRTASFANNVISDGVILIDSYYSEALYQIDVM